MANTDNDKIVTRSKGRLNMRKTAKTNLTSECSKKKINRTNTDNDKCSNKKNDSVMIHKLIIPHLDMESDVNINKNIRDGCNFSRFEEHYLMSLDDCERNDIIFKMKRFSKIHKIPIRFRVLHSKLPNKYDILSRITSSCDNGKLESWVENALSLPIDVFAPPPLNVSSCVKQFLLETRQKMDEFVYGQNEAKDEILRLLCQWISSGTLQSFAIALEGPPGIGKTTFAKNIIANVMNRPFNFISLGGANDASYLLGHSYTYDGAIPGRIAEAVKMSKVMNPCFYFDELDKISKTSKGDEISNILVHLTDKEQNSEFSDRYFNGIKMDLSQSFFVFSYNNRQEINHILLDRLNIVKLNSPTLEDKICIAKEHLIPKALKASAFKKHEIFLEDDVLEFIISNYTNEEGVRNLDKAICKIISTIAVLLKSPNALVSTKCEYDLSSKCTKKIVAKILGNGNADIQTNRHMTMYN